MYSKLSFVMLVFILINPEFQKLPSAASKEPQLKIQTKALHQYT